VSGSQGEMSLAERAEEGATESELVKGLAVKIRGVREEGTARERGKVRERDVAHALVVIHFFTCGEHQRTGNGNFSKCKYALVKNIVA